MNLHFRDDQATTLQIINGDFDPQGIGYQWGPPHISLYDTSYGSHSQRIDNKLVVTKLTLPDSRSLNFKYNRYGEVAELQMPTGGKVQYDFQSVLSNDETGEGLPTGNSLDCETCPRRSRIPCDVKAIDRAVTARRTYPDGNTGGAAEGRWTYT